MGCGGSKTAKASAPSQIPEGDFKIILENAAGSESLGATVNFPEKKYILVEAVSEEGLIPAWNKRCENMPEMQMKAGDLIVVVNGVFGNSDLMLAELKSMAITPTVKGGAIAAETPAAEAPAAEAPAAEAAAPAAEAPAAEAPAAEAPAAEAPAAELAPPAPQGPAAESPAAEATPANVKSKEIVLTVKRGPIAVEAPAAEAPAADDWGAAEPPAATAPVAEAAAPAAEAPTEAGTAAEVPAAEAPRAEVPAVEAGTEEPEAEEVPITEMLAVNLEADLATVQPGDGEIGADAKEERFCKLAGC